VQILALLTVADVIWLFVMMSTWSHTAADKNEYWKSLSGMHTFALIFAFLELILKGLIMAYLVYDYKQKNPNELSKKIYLFILY
jgi:ABC-type sugar transport system permease subunit